MRAIYVFVNKIIKKNCAIVSAKLFYWATLRYHITDICKYREQIKLVVYCLLSGTTLDSFFHILSVFCKWKLGTRFFLGTTKNN